MELKSESDVMGVTVILMSGRLKKTGIDLRVAPLVIYGSLQSNIVHSHVMPCPGFTPLLLLVQSTDKSPTKICEFAEATTE
jgi:hypothetical protein